MLGDIDRDMLTRALQEGDSYRLAHEDNDLTINCQRWGTHDTSINDGIGVGHFLNLVFKPFCVCWLGRGARCANRLALIVESYSSESAHYELAPIELDVLSLKAAGRSTYSLCWIDLPQSEQFVYVVKFVVREAIIGEEGACPPHFLSIS